MPMEYRWQVTCCGDKEKNHATARGTCCRRCHGVLRGFLVLGRSWKLLRQKPWRTPLTISTLCALLEANTALEPKWLRNASMRAVWSDRLNRTHIVYQKLKRIRRLTDEKMIPPVLSGNALPFILRARTEATIGSELRWAKSPIANR